MTEQLPLGLRWIAFDLDDTHHPEIPLEPQPTGQFPSMKATFAFHDNATIPLRPCAQDRRQGHRTCRG